MKDVSSMLPPEIWPLLHLSFGELCEPPDYIEFCRTHDEDAKKPIRLAWSFIFTEYLFSKYLPD